DRRRDQAAVSFRHHAARVAAAGAGPASISCFLRESTRRFMPSGACAPRRLRAIPRDSRTGAGSHDNSAPGSTRTDSSVRRSPGRAGFSISTLTRNAPISSPIVPPRSLPSSTTGARAVSISRALRRGAVLLACMPIASLAAQQAAGPAWTRGAVCYEVFVRSFYDSNGDGIGDLTGLIEKLDYLDKLGASCIGLMPVAESPSSPAHTATPSHLAATASLPTAHFQP